MVNVNYEVSFPHRHTHLGKKSDIKHEGQSRDSP